MSDSINPIVSFSPTICWSRLFGVKDHHEKRKKNCCFLIFYIKNLVNFLFKSIATKFTRWLRSGFEFSFRRKKFFRQKNEKISYLRKISFFFSSFLLKNNFLLFWLTPEGIHNSSAGKIPAQQEPFFQWGFGLNGIYAFFVWSFCPSLSLQYKNFFNNFSLSQSLFHVIYVFWSGFDHIFWMFPFWKCSLKFSK